MQHSHQKKKKGGGGTLQNLHVSYYGGWHQPIIEHNQSLNDGQRLALSQPINIVMK